MNLEAAISLEIIVTIIAVVGAVWRLDSKIADLRDKLEGEIKASRNELKGDIRQLDAKIDETRKELKGDIYRLQDQIDRVEAKVDDGNQRLARLEGRFEGREERLESES